MDVTASRWANLLFCFFYLVALQGLYGQSDVTISRSDWGQALPAEAVQIRHVLDGRFQPLGIAIVTGKVDEALARGGIGEPIGVRVSQIISNGVAAGAGMRVGDLILRVNNRAINSGVDLSSVLNSATLDQVQTLAILRGQQRLQVSLWLPSTASKQSPCPSYAHPSGEYRFSYLPGWKLDANVHKEAVTERTYHYLQSAEGEYRFHLFADSSGAADARQSLISFQQEAAKSFLSGYAGWVVLGDLPATFASGVVGRERLFTLYRLAFVAGGKRFEMDVYTPPYHDPARLPNVLEIVLGTMQPVGASHVLRAYVFHENGNASGVVWALPKDAPFPAPDAVPVLEQHLFQAPKRGMPSTISWMLSREMVRLGLTWPPRLCAGS